MYYVDLRNFNFCANFTVFMGDRDRWSEGERTLDNSYIVW